MVHDLILESRLHIDKMVAALVTRNDEPLVDAYLACLEAASSVGRALEQSTVDGHAATTDAVREALHASRAAATAIRFSLFSLSDRELATGHNGNGQNGNGHRE